VLAVTLGAVALAFYVGMMFERKGVSRRVGLAENAATPATPAAPQATPAAPPESSAERFDRLRRAVDLAPAPEAARMASEAGGAPLDSRDPEFLYLYGRALLLSDRQAEAADAFDRAILRINENMTPANGELKIDARIAKVAAHLRARDEAAALSAAEALSEVVRPQTTQSPQSPQSPQPAGPEAGAAAPTP
jgi:hypothetical protein